MNIVCLDLEGVLVPEIWIAFSQVSGIPELKRTTRDEPDYDKLIDSRFADMKNSGGRNAGSITAAQFLRRFVGDTPWAHLDIAGTAMSSPETDINRAWASGFGVRLLDRLVRNRFES